MEKIITEPRYEEKHGFKSWEPGTRVELSDDGSLVEISHFYDEGEEDFDAVGGMPVIGVRPGDELERLIEALQEIHQLEETNDDDVVSFAHEVLMRTRKPFDLMSDTELNEKQDMIRKLAGMIVNNMDNKKSEG